MQVLFVGATVLRLFEPAANEETASWAPTSTPKRKACKRATKRLLRQVGLPKVVPEIMGQNDVSRRFAVEKCLTCQQCPRLAGRLAAWRVRSEARMLRPPRS